MEIVRVCGAARRVVFYLAVVFTWVTVSSTECEGQLLRRHWAKQWNQVPRQVQAASEHVVEGGQSERISDLAPVARLPKWPYSYAKGNGYDPRIHPDADAWSRYPKFIGGFHSSHFTNVGLPNGDIGFRGNGLYWAPW